MNILLKSVEQLDYDKSKIEVIIVRVPNDSGALKIVSDFSKRSIMNKIKVLESSTHSVSVKRNLGILEASSNIVIVVDDDIVLNPKTVRRALELLKDPRVVAVGFPAISEHPSLPEKLHHGRFLGTVTKGVNTVMPVTAFRKDILVKHIGLYREDMGPPYTIHEDWELGSRIRSKGYEILIDGFTPQLHKPKIKDNHKNNSIKENQAYSQKLLGYINTYLNKNWRTLLMVMNSGPVSQKIEYVHYFIAPWIFVIMLFVNPMYDLLYIVFILVISILYSILRGYYRTFGLKERLAYPVVLPLIRILRTNLAVVGFLKKSF